MTFVWAFATYTEFVLLKVNYLYALYFEEIALLVAISCMLLV